MGWPLLRNSSVSVIRKSGQSAKDAKSGDRSEFVSDLWSFCLAFGST